MSDIRLYADEDDHKGIVVSPDQRYSIGEKIRRLTRLVATASTEEMVNRMEYL